MYIQDFKELKVWQRSVELSILVYKLTEQFPKSETFGLVSQMRRAGVSIASNIAEGKKRGTRKDFQHFLRIADGSAAELETQIVIAQNLYENISFQEIQGTLLEVQKMLSTLIKHLITNH